jgi:hypothetical protein
MLSTKQGGTAMALQDRELLKKIADAMQKEVFAQAGRNEKIRTIKSTLDRSECERLAVIALLAIRNAGCVICEDDNAPRS